MIYLLYQEWNAFVSKFLSLICPLSFFSTLRKFTWGQFLHVNWLGGTVGESGWVRTPR